MGGYIAMQLLRDVPERIAALLLLDTRETPDTEEGRATRYKQADDVAKNGIGSVVEAMLPKMVVQESYRAEVRRIMETSSPQRGDRRAEGDGDTSRFDRDAAQRDDAGIRDRRRSRRDHAGPRRGADGVADAERGDGADRARRTHGEFRSVGAGEQSDRRIPRPRVCAAGERRRGLRRAGPARGVCLA